MNKTLLRARLSWGFALEQARYNGTGRYKWSPAIDIATYFKIIQCLDNNDFKTAQRLYWNMDTAAREMIPMKISDFLDKLNPTQKIIKRIVYEDN
jgi:hypothetical protein